MSEHIRESIQNAQEYLRQNPEEARYTDSEATAVLKEGLYCQVATPDGKIVDSDMPGGVGGGGSAPSPGWLMRAALANCDATLIAMRAAQEGIQLSNLEVTVDSVSDDRGLLGVDDSIPAGPFSMRTRVRIAAEGVEPEKLEEVIRWAEAHSPVADAIRRAVPMETEVEVGV
jgi:uncharacterized OsmC-like protein